MVLAHLRRWRPLSAWRGQYGVRSFGTADEDKYLELKQLKDIKSEGFYDLQAHKRRYFYYVDLQGRLFLEDTRPKNIATSLKSAKFLRFFFSQVRPNGIAQCKAKEEEEFLEYPHRSPCGKEMNFIKCADRPFVFEDLRRDKNDKWALVFGGGELTMPFLPETLRISLSTGRLYHDVQTKHVASGTPEGIALVRSQLAVELGKSIDVHDFPDDNAKQDVNSLVIGDFKWENQHYAIHAIE
ncbi:putative mitochondrial protein [Phytophthora megakarya]|uniref:Putative mitochondrial protein n=1 Tax=Phytophthora megakarya TaxID=4795 RepID=A0A225W8X5_9STRA|nr:putative mitochondrial protein [Phytophthora megakarya]